jgi:hypothetical protein
MTADNLAAASILSVAFFVFSPFLLLKSTHQTANYNPTNQILTVDTFMPKTSQQQQSKNNTNNLLKVFSSFRFNQCATSVFVSDFSATVDDAGGDFFAAFSSCFVIVVTDIFDVVALLLNKLLGLTALLSALFNNTPNQLLSFATMLRFGVGSCLPLQQIP